MEGVEDLCGNNVQAVRSALEQMGHTVQIYENERFMPMYGWVDTNPETGDPTRFEDQEGKSWMKVTLSRPYAIPLSRLRWLLAVSRC